MILQTVVNYSKEFWDLKLQVDKLIIDVIRLKQPLWKDILFAIIPILSIISGFLIGWFVPSRTFRKSIEQENRKKDELNKKEHRDLIRSYYGEIAELSQALVIELGIMNVHLINSNYYLKLAELQDTEKRKETLEKRVRQENRYYDSVNKAGLLTNKINRIVYEYHFTTPNSKILDKLKEFKSYSYDIAQSEKFTPQMNKEQLETTRKNQITNSKTIVANTITKALEKMGNCIRVENLTKDELVIFKGQIDKLIGEEVQEKKESN